MSERPLIGLDSRPSLPRHVRLRFDRARARWTLLAPERVLLLDEAAREILRRCDGETRVAGIVAALTEIYDAPEKDIRNDVQDLLQDLADKRLIRL